MAAVAGRRAKKKQTAVEFAIGVLASRSLPEHRLRQRLAARYDEDEVEGAVARLCELGMVDDDAWAERFARDRFERLGKGRHRIRAELVTRGIDGRVADAALARVVQGDVERRHAAQALETLRRSLGPPARAPDGGGNGPPPSPDPDSARESERLKNRLFRRMLVRGYPASVVRDLLGVS